jgi:hypothetical protein
MRDRLAILILRFHRPPRAEHPQATYAIGCLSLAIIAVLAGIALTVFAH